MQHKQAKSMTESNILLRLLFVTHIHGLLYVCLFEMKTTSICYGLLEIRLKCYCSTLLLFISSTYMCLGLAWSLSILHCIYKLILVRYCHDAFAVNEFRDLVTLSYDVLIFSSRHISPITWLTCPLFTNFEWPTINHLWRPQTDRLRHHVTCKYRIETTEHLKSSTLSCLFSIKL